MSKEPIAEHEGGAEITPCPNCGFNYPDEYMYCPQCGQKNEDSVLSFKEMFFDLMSAFFSFDTKAIRSFPKLLFLPGSLTSEYVNGKRETYLAPFRLYLFISIVLFLSLPMVVTDKALFSPNIIDAPGQIDSIGNEFAQNVIESLDSVELEEVDQFLGDSIEVKNGNKLNWNVNRQSNSSIINFGADTLDSAAWSKALALIKEGYSIDEAADSIFVNQTDRNKFFIKQGLKLQDRRGKGLLSAFLDKASYTLFIFLPVFALFLKLLYIRSKRYYIEHLIFSLHFFSFFFFIIILYVLTYKFIAHIPFFIIPIIALVYLYGAMYKVYQQRWLKTFFKWFTLIFGTCALFLPLFFVIALVISLIFY